MLFRSNSIKKKSVGKKTSATWITSKDKDCKRVARQLERRYHATKLEADYIIWRKAGRAAVRAMNEARTDHYKTEIERATGEPRILWRVIKELLHSSPPSALLDPSAAKKRADDFFYIFH